MQRVLGVLSFIGPCDFNMCYLCLKSGSKPNKQKLLMHFVSGVLPIGLCVCTLVPQLVALSGKAVEPLGGEALWEKSESLEGRLQVL